MWGERQRLVTSNHKHFIKFVETNFISLPPPKVIHAFQGKLLGSSHNKIDEVTAASKCAEGKEVSENPQESS